MLALIVVPDAFATSYCVEPLSERIEQADLIAVGTVSRVSRTDDGPPVIEVAEITVDTVLAVSTLPTTLSSKLRRGGKISVESEPGIWASPCQGIHAIWFLNTNGRQLVSRVCFSPQPMPPTIESTDRLLDELDRQGSEAVVVRPRSLLAKAQARTSIIARYLKSQRDYLPIREHSMLNVVPR